MLRGQSSRKAKLNSKPNVILEKGNRWEKYIVSISGKKIISTEMDKLHRW
jgi:hypothetical protein